jgi:UDP-N-acetylmuramyl pentapeptide phosphotransferase/UDP-N-acetylglucosamine-1-phosphate transferase
VNFMDGIDWMTVAEVLPVTAGLAILGVLGALPPYGIIAALALFGATLGFAPFNRPVARLFLGDVGSLPLGLLIGWLLLLLAARGHHRRRISPAALLSRRCDGNAVWTHRAPRAILARASHAFLSARER